MANILLISHILSLFHSPKVPQKSRQNMENLENIASIVLETML